MHHESYTLHTLLHTLQASHTEHAQKREKTAFTSATYIALMTYIIDLTNMTYRMQNIDSLREHT